MLKNWWEKRSDKRIVVSLVFVFCLAFFLHYREERVEALEPNAKAERYVLAQDGFEFPDVEATSLLKQESMRDVGKIYHIDEKQIFQQEEEGKKFLAQNPIWRATFADATFDELYENGEALREILLKARFVDERTYKKMVQLQMPLEKVWVFVPEDPNKSILSKEIWDQIQREISPLVVDYFRLNDWSLQEDLTAQNAVRQAVKASIPLKRTRIEPGSRIINAGETVTSRHLDMMKAMKKAVDEKRHLLAPATLLGSLLMSFALTLLSVIYIRFQHPGLLKSFHKLALLATIIVLTLTLSKLTDYFLVNKSGTLVDIFRYPIFVPFGTLLVSLLVASEVALVASGFLAVVLGITLSIEYDRFLVINLVAALVAIVSARAVRRRKEVFEACAKIWLSTIPLLFAFNLLENTFWNVHLVTDLITTFVFLSCTAIVVVGLLPILESAFGQVTDMTLMEYMDPHHPILRRLSVEAPGTYQHSLVVATISEAAAQSIGASGLFCRVSTLYHDIGKLSNPPYFSENQFSGVNIHKLLMPVESAQVIISHVKDGVALAERYGLPDSFIDVIKQHHGTTPVYCFYHAQMQRAGRVDEHKFRYPGPKPRSKESAIIMIGDTVEAAFRALEEIDEKIITQMVDRLVAQKIEERQLEECQLTFEELGTIKKAMVRTLLISSHARVKYPVKHDASLSNDEALSLQHT